MANRYSDPDVQFADSTGAALAGAQVFFYATGTATKQNTYSDAALSIANPNPIALDANGRIGSVFLQNLKYKVVLAPATDTDPPTSPIWTQDPVYSSDVSTVAQLQGTNGNPTGQLAGTAGSVGIPASMDWDFTNNILYVCTTTGNVATAGWTAINASTAAAVFVPPQGRLTMTTATPVLSSDVIAGTTVFYTPYTGLLVPIFNGTTFVPTSIVSELNATLVASHVANKIYDWYIINVNGVATLASGVSWDAGTGGSVAAGACNRGLGAGSAQLAGLNGILTNGVAMTMRYGNGTLTTTVPANQGTLVGSMFMDATNGQVTCHVSYGQLRKWGLWNLYNRKPIVLQMGDPTASWVYGATSFRQSNNSASNVLTTFTGGAEEWIDNVFIQKVTIANGAAANLSLSSTIALNGGGVGTLGFFSNQVASTTSGAELTASFPMNPQPFGINNIATFESGSAGGGVGTWFGTQGNMLLRSSWLG